MLERPTAHARAADGLYAALKPTLAGVCEINTELEGHVSVVIVPDEPPRAAPTDSCPR
jgi:hypothetical protein